MMSQPASACTSACRTSTATVSSLRILPSSISPSWPWLVKGSSATSQSTPRSGKFLLDGAHRLADEIVGIDAPRSRARRAATARYRETARCRGCSSFTARSASRTAWSTLSRSTPGIEATAVRVLWPSTTNSGQIRSSVVRTFSRTSRRAHSALRLRRGRTARSRAGAARAVCSPRRVAHFDRTPEFDRHVIVSPETAGWI